MKIQIVESLTTYSLNFRYLDTLYKTYKSLTIHWRMLKENRLISL